MKGSRGCKRAIALATAIVATVGASTALAGSAAQTTGNGKLAYTAVASALQLFAQAPEVETARRIVVSESVDYEPVLAPDGTRVAFVSSRSGNDEIYVANVNGTSVRRLTAHPAYDRDPAWSPDSQRLAFVSGRAGNSDLYVVGADGRGLTRLTSTGMDEENPAWSPDGAKLALWTTSEDDAEIVVMNADGTDTRALTANADEDAFPAWSPDGGRIAFTSDRGTQSDAEIWVMSADGTGAAQVTNTAGSIDDWRPTWSPDGARIAFVSDRGGDADVFVAGIDGKGVVNMTDNEDVDDLHPSWARDGRILFTSERAANLGVEAVDPSGRNRVVLARSPLEETEPAWSPDGTRIAFTVEREEGSGIYVASSTGKGRRQLARDASFADSDPAWSPDSRQLAFIREDEFEMQYLFVVNADGSGLRFVREGSGLCCPDWSPSGREIALTDDGDVIVVGVSGRGRRLVSSNGWAPSWSPDGRLIAFDSDRDDVDGDEDDFDIFVVSARGGPATQLTDNDVDDEWAEWSPDGRFIAFSRGDLDDLEGSIYIMRPNGKGVRRVPLQAPAAMPAWQPLP